MIDRHQQRQTIRSRVLAVIEVASRPLTGKEVAQAAGIPYKPAIDALNKLYDYGKVRRTGAKFTARWSVNQSLLSNAESADLLTRIMLAMSLKSRGK